MELQSTIIQVELADGTIVSVEATTVDEQLIGDTTLSFEGVTTAIESIVKDISVTIQKIKPDKASVKFGLEVAVESKGLTALLAKGSGKANLEITLEWGN